MKLIIFKYDDLFTLSIFLNSVSLCMFVCLSIFFSETINRIENSYLENSQHFISYWNVGNMHMHSLKANV